MPDTDPVAQADDEREDVTTGEEEASATPEPDPVVPDAGVPKPRFRPTRRPKWPQLRRPARRPTTRPRWVRRVVFVLCALFVLVLIGQATSAKRAANRATRSNEAVLSVGEPLEAQWSALQMVATVLGRTGVVVDVQRDDDSDPWTVKIMVDATCYEVLVRNGVASATPGSMPCPDRKVASAEGFSYKLNEEPAATIGGYLALWLSGDPNAERFLADDTNLLPRPDLDVSGVKVTRVVGPDPAVVEIVPGDSYVFTVSADVSTPKGVEHQAWTVKLTKGASRWDVTGLSGGHVPTGEQVAPTYGIVTTTTTPVITAPSKG